MTLNIFLCLFFISSICQSYTAFPKQMGEKERQTVLNIVGLGSSTKYLSSPYPLGGYSGVDVGVSYEKISVKNFISFTTTDSSPQDIEYFRIVLGKGIYNSIDTYIHFIPFTQSVQISEFGGFIRWNFFQAQVFPGTISLSLHGNHSNFFNQLNTSNYGIDLTFGIVLKNFSLYLGGGKIYSQGTFIGGDNGITAPEGNETYGRTHIELAQNFRPFAGLTFNLTKINFSIQLDYFSQSIISSKLGLRF